MTVVALVAMVTMVMVGLEMAAVPLLVTVPLVPARLVMTPVAKMSMAVSLRCCARK